MSRLIISPSADEDLYDIYAYIARDSKTRARNFVDRLRLRCAAIADSPGIGRRRDEWYPGLRSLPEGDYLIFYRAIEGDIEVARIVHGARNITPDYFDDLDEEPLNPQ